MLTLLLGYTNLLIPGMNPEAVGTSSDEKNSDPEEEKLLIHQDFVSDPTMTVGEVLQQEALEVVHFIRYECGEETDSRE